MTTDTTGIEIGMTVRDMHGEEIGHVADIWPYVPASWAEGPRRPSQAPPETTEVGYFSVDHGGVLNIGTQHLYVPFKTIGRVVPGEGITLNGTKRECEETYTRTPWFVHRDVG